MRQKELDQDDDFFFEKHGQQHEQPRAANERGCDAMRCSVESRTSARWRYERIAFRSASLSGAASRVLEEGIRLPRYKKRRTRCASVENDNIEQPGETILYRLSQARKDSARLALFFWRFCVNRHALDLRELRSHQHFGAFGKLMGVFQLDLRRERHM